MLSDIREAPMLKIRLGAMLITASVFLAATIPLQSALGQSALSTTNTSAPTATRHGIDLNLSSTNA
ncbi:MAG: hypothetical protein K2X81_09715, partial [Candidatus Obscuribacterales bacterium]|nr:hypothetical protein [Candidatus Obscuribacterales bacterium]